MNWQLLYIFFIKKGREGAVTPSYQHQLLGRRVLNFKAFQIGGDNAKLWFQGYQHREINSQSM